MHVHNIRVFSQGKLEGEINSRFLSNEYGDLFFLLHNNNVHIILFDLMWLVTVSSTFQDLEFDGSL